jgi:hypothetical protein
MIRGIGGPLHGMEIPPPHYWPDGYACEPGEDGVLRFVHNEAVELPNGVVITLREGDAVVLAFDRDLSMEEAVRVREQWMRELSSFPLVIVSGAKVSVLRHELEGEA